MSRHLFTVDEAPHIEAELPAAENPDRTVLLRCTVCDTRHTFDSDGMHADRVRERIMGFALEHAACTLTASPTARELARMVEEDAEVLEQRKRVEALDEEARGLAFECERSPLASFADWQKADRLARAARAKLTAERLAVQRRILDEWRRRVDAAAEREAEPIREIS